MADAVADIVDTVLVNHPRDCIFAPGARDRIVAAVRALPWPPPIDDFVKAVQAEEIYCPHEGIDRRAPASAA